MDRRSFIKKAGLATGAAAASTLAAPAIAQGVKQLRMVTSWPKNFPGLGTAARRFAERLEAASGGRYKVKLYAGGELVSPIKCMDAVQEGTADLYHSAEYYYQGKNAGFAFYSAVPFGFRPDEMDAWVHHGGGQKIWDEMGAEFGVKGFLCGNSGSQMAGWFRKPITSLDDFKGLKMRIPGLGGKVINAIGGSAQLLGGKDIMPALQAGTIDATEWVGPWNDLAFGFYKVLKHYGYPGFHEPGTALSLGVSTKLWNGLDKADKEMFTVCATAENNYDLAEFNANNSAALETLLNKHGVKLFEMPDEVFKALGEASKDVVATAGASSPIAKKVYDSFMAFRKNVTGWSRLSDQAYMNKRDLVKF